MDVAGQQTADLLPGLKQPAAVALVAGRAIERGGGSQEPPRGGAWAGKAQPVPRYASASRPFLSSVITNGVTSNGIRPRH